MEGFIVDGMRICTAQKRILLAVLWKEEIDPVMWDV
jgi:hypothetical protein